MRMHQTVFIFFFLLFSINVSVHAYNLRQITNRDNLSNSSIISMYQDTRGLVWFGTCDGLNVYNGRHVSEYQPKDDNSILSGNLIDKIFEAEDGVLWIQTYYGINRWDRKNNTVEHFKMFNRVLFIEKDKNNNVFIIQGDNSIFYFDKMSRQFKKINLPGIVFNDIIKFSIDAHNNMWLFTKKGYTLHYTIDRDKNDDIVLTSAKAYKHPSPLLYSFSDGEDIFLIDAYYNLFEFHSERGDATLVCNIHAEIGEHGTIAQVLKFHNEYFIGFKTDGLYVFRMEKSLSEKKMSAQKIPINCGIFSLIKDRYQDILWIGTDGQGVYSYSNDLYSIKSTQLNDFTLKIGRPVRAIFLDKENTLWIGSKGDGILKIYNYDIDKHVLDCPIETLTTRNSLLSDNSVYSFAESSRNGLWIGSEDGINYYSYRDRKLKKLPLSDGNLSIKYIHDIYEQGSVLWIASVGLGLIKAEIGGSDDTPTLKVQKRFTIHNEDKSSNYFFTIKPIDEHTILFGNRGAGVFKIDTRVSELKSLAFNNNDNQLLSEIFSIEKDDKDDFLLGSSYGLIKYNTHTCDYAVLNKTNGLLSNTVHSILHESGNTFWFSTNRGLVRYDSEKETIRNYEISDGLNVVEFSDGASFKDERRGILFFGGINGFVSVCRENNESHDYMPPIYFDQLSILGKEYNIYEFLVEKGGGEFLELGYDQNFFSISFTAIDYLNGNNYNYYYKLEGVNDQWIDNGNSNSISFTNFNPGDYTLSIKYYNRATDSESSVYQLRIRVLPPWYMSGWAYFSYFAMIVVVILLLIRYIVIRNRNKREQLVMTMEQQHKEEIYESKLSFFTNIAHEFCTPLTLIYGPCSRILNHRNIDNFVVKHTSVIQQNAERLNSLIQDLIDFRRIETGYKKPRIEEICITDILKQVIGSFSDIIESRGINMELDMPDNITWNSDRNFLITITTNLVSNALKYMDQRGSIKIGTSIEDHQLKIVVSNTGRGINTEEISKIFDRYRILDNFENRDHTNSWSRNGLGLAISYSMIILLDGTINIESIPDSWTDFTIMLPEKEISTDKILISGEPLPLVKGNVEKNIVNQLPDNKVDESKPTILVIDDEAEILWLLNDIFIEDFNVLLFQHPDDAMSAFEDRHPDIILCDVMMGDCDGISFTRNLKMNSKTAHIPLILISAKHEVEEQIEGINAGAELYVTKPFNVDYLRTSVKHLLSRKEALKNYFTSPLSAFEQLNGQLTHKEHKKLMKEIFDIINKNVKNNDLSVNFIAAKMNMSARNLYRKVSEISNISISDLIRDSRLYIAADLLIRSKSTIDEIIFQSGFSNRVSFFKAFSKKYGCTPKEYRDKNSLEDVK